jgi:hypothetical protein
MVSGVRRAGSTPGLTSASEAMILKLDSEAMILKLDSEAMILKPVAPEGILGAIGFTLPSL